MTGFFRPIRRRLRMIGYYSARRDRTIWTRMREWILPLAFVLSVTAVVTGEVISLRARTLGSVRGMLLRERSGELFARAQDVRAPAGANPGSGGVRPADAMHGEFTALVERRERGWPFTTAISDSRPRLDLNLYAEADNRIDVRLTEHSSIVDAIDHMQWPDDAALVEEAWRDRRADGAVDIDRHWWGTIGTVMAWWVAFAFLLQILLIFARFGFNLLRVKKSTIESERRERGLCTNCGYSLRGIEFHARCPECGTLVR